MRTSVRADSRFDGVIVEVGLSEGRARGDEGEQDLPGRAALVRGTRLEREGLVEEALAFYREAVRLAPLDPAGYLRLGLALRGIGQDDEANRALQAALDLG